jgi:uncharacterized protein (TIGR04222 family)
VTAARRGAGWRACGAAAAWLVLSATSGAPAALGVTARSLLVERFDAVITVFRSGNLEVEERLQVRFTGAWNGIERRIPIAGETAEGLGTAIDLEVQGVDDGAGRPLRWEGKREGREQVVRAWVPDAVDAVRTLRIRYRVGHVLGHPATHDELQWNVTGDAWAMPIAQATARVILPTGATGVRAAAFTGAFGSRARDADVEVRGDEVQVRLQRPLALREGLTVVVGWDKGVVHAPSTAARLARTVRLNWPFGLPLLAVAVMGWLWHRHGRDPRLGPITARYEPPEGLSPAEAGTLVDGKLDLRDVTATVVDLAVRGYVAIARARTAGLLAFGGSDWRFTLVKPRPAWEGLAAYERALLDALFERGESVTLGDLEHRFYTALPGLRDLVFAGMLARGYWRRRPDEVRSAFLAVAVALVGAAIVGAGLLTGALGGTRLAWAVGGFVSAGVVAAFGWFMPARTAVGGRALAEVLGFEEFLSRVDEDRLTRVAVTPELFERHLPFAMALGVEARWVEAFARMHAEPPRWYQNGDGVFEPRLLVADLGRMASQAATAMTAAPRSASDAGGLGGFSGSGSGGGGGSGF